MQETEWFEGRSVEKRERRRLIILPWLVWAVIVGLAIGSVLYAGRVQAALSYEAMGGNGQAAKLRLSEAPCTNAKVIKHLHALIKPEYISQFKAAVLTWGGRDWHSCWLILDLIDQNGRDVQTIWSVDEEGAPFNPPYGVPRSLFREDSI